MGMKKRTFSGTTSNEITEREIRNKNISRRAAGEGVVLLKNEGLLPLTAGNKLAVFGNGFAKVIKGGTGSGDVNERAVVSLLEGLKEAGYVIVNEEAAKKYAKDFEKSELVRRDNVLKGLAELEKGGGSDMGFFKVFAEAKGSPFDEIPVIESEVRESDAALFVISRICGEGADRHAEPGDYYLSDAEEKTLEEIKKFTDNIIVLINTGAQIDLKDLQGDDKIKSIVYLSQPGMEAGHVAADILTGKVNPSGKLTTTWAMNYGDYPCADTFGHRNGDLDNEYYNDGIYVGYRFFDSFGVEVLYPFGFGLSYTTFTTEPGEVEVDVNTVRLTAKVTNTGSVPGKEVVQVYAACPQTKAGKELKKLVGFKKTGLLAPGTSETVEIFFDAKSVASYDYDRAAWVVDAGRYGIFAGNNSYNITLAGVLKVEEDVIIEEVSHILPLQCELEEIKPDGRVIDDFTRAWEKESKDKGLKELVFEPWMEELVRLPENEHIKDAKAIAEKLTDDELIALLMGEITKGQDNIKENELVETGIYVPGAAGETTCMLEKKYGVPAISMADGPAGLRLMRSYDVDDDKQLIYGVGILSAIEGGFYAQKYERDNVTKYYMYATAIPIGTLLAQTWDPAVIEEVGEMIGQEMVEFNVAWWLAPGMNIHRNPLCGRNFEYFSEDPLVAGVIAAAMTNGVQKNPGIGTTIKHFACNNLEDNRLHNNSNLSERALREIYLRNFEIAVKTSQPMCVMSSYNLINKVPAANATDLFTTVLRGEWDFKGIVMTDWTTTTSGSATSYKCAIAGNDLIMPGKDIDVKNIKEALESGSLPRQKAVECATRLISVIFSTLGMEEAKPYNTYYKD